MKITILDTTVLLELDAMELGAVTYSLGSFLQLAASPRKRGDHATPEDVERVNQMEKELFAAWCKLTDQQGVIEQALREIREHAALHTP